MHFELTTSTSPFISHSASIASPIRKNEGKLIFNRRPLSEVFAEIERYMPGSLVVAGRLPDTPVSGVFNLDDVPGMLSVLSRTQPVRIYQLPWLTVVMNARSTDQVAPGG